MQNLSLSDILKSHRLMDLGSLNNFQKKIDLSGAILTQLNNKAIAF